MRPVLFRPHIAAMAAGSCMACFGQTQVICTVCLEPGVPPFMKDKPGGWLTAEYAMLPGSTPGGRKKREIKERDGRSTEIQRLIGRSLRAAVHLERLPAITLAIDCDVLQADGGTRTAAISGSWVALVLALRHLAARDASVRPDHCLAGQVAAVSVGVVDGQVVCDLDYAHDSRAEVDCNVVMRDGALVEVQGTGEHGVFDRAALDRLLDAAATGIAEVRRAQIQALSA